MNILDGLQKEVYKLDFKIGSLASNLSLDITNQYDNDGDLKEYKTLTVKRAVVIKCLERLKSINL